MNKFSIAPLFLLAGALLMGAVQMEPISYTIQLDESSMRVEGTSTIHDWSCAVKSLDGSFEIDTTAAESSVITGVDRAHVTVPVEQIDCDKDTMNRKLREALKVNAYPEVMYSLNSATMKALPEDAGKFEVQTTGELIIAGTRNQIDMTVTGQRLKDGRLRFVGQHSLKLSDFDVERPSAMFGTIKTGDEVTVHFDVTAAP